MQECNDPIGHIGLGRAYYDGSGGLQQNFNKALVHFEKAYAAHLPESGIYMGLMTYKGLATKKDIMKAKEYFEFSSAHEFCLAYIYLARINFSSGHIFKAVKLLSKGVRLINSIKKVDRSDRRLIGIER